MSRSASGRTSRVQSVSVRGSERASQYATPPPLTSQSSGHRDTLALTTAINEAEDIITKYHPLNSFGCVMTVALHHHAKGQETVRKHVQFCDNLRWPQFQAWAQVCLGSRVDGDKLRYEYYDELRRPTPIDGMNALQKWLDIMWVHHPLELHVYEPGAQPSRTPQEEHLAIAHHLFMMYDLDASGTICTQEQLMAKELSVVYDAEPELVARFLRKAFSHKS